MYSQNKVKGSCGRGSAWIRYSIFDIRYSNHICTQLPDEAAQGSAHGILASIAKPAITSLLTVILNVMSDPSKLVLVYVSLLMNLLGVRIGKAKVVVIIIS